MTAVLAEGRRRELRGTDSPRASGQRGTRLQAVTRFLVSDAASYVTGEVISRRRRHGDVAIQKGYGPFLITLGVEMEHRGCNHRHRRRDAARQHGQGDLGGHGRRALRHRPHHPLRHRGLQGQGGPAEVKDFDGAALLGKQEAAHLDLYSQYALVASDEAMADSGLGADGAIDHERLGVYVGSGTGGINAFADNCHTIAERGPPSRLPVHDHDDDRQHGHGQHRHPPQGARPHAARRDRVRHLRPRDRRGLPRDQARLRRRHPRRRRGGGHHARVHRRLHEAAAPSPPTPTPPPRAARSTPTATASSWARVPACSSSRVGARRRARRPHLRRGRGLRATPTTPTTSPPPTPRPPASPAPSAWPWRRAA